jgi:enamine deaminase RidA (YjgF/YER057c/UK114 family)
MADHCVVPGLFPPPDYAHAAVVDAGERLVFTAGAVPLDASGTLIGAGDFIAQTNQVLANLEATLQAAGTDLEYVINTTVYVVATERRHLSDVWSVVRASGLRKVTRSCKRPNPVRIRSPRNRSKRFSIGLHPSTF